MGLFMGALLVGANPSMVLLTCDGSTFALYMDNLETNRCVSTSNFRDCSRYFERTSTRSGISNVLFSISFVYSWLQDSERKGASFFSNRYAFIISVSRTVGKHFAAFRLS